VVGFRCGKVENLGGRMRRMKKRGPNVLFDLNDLLFFLTLFLSLRVSEILPLYSPVDTSYTRNKFCTDR